MKLARYLPASAFFSTVTLARDLCTTSDECWPSPDVWTSFNSSIDGRLIAPRPPAWSCHDPNYDEAACSDAKSNWYNPFWRSNQTGAAQSTVWDSLECGIDTPRNETCRQGLVPIYSVVAQEAGDVSKAVAFAKQHKVRLVVKNTGHDFLGRSSGEGSLSVWTHRLKGINFTDSFVPNGCEKEPGTSAVTLGAAEQWRDVYQAADGHNVTVVGGAAASVGAAGGWLTGGGHSPLGFMHGMGVDNVLQFSVAMSDGSIAKVNACQDTDLFWAMRGGGGSAWGVILDVTYKTHPPLSSISSVIFTANTTSTQKLKELNEVFLRSVPNITDQGIRGYALLFPPTSFRFLAIHPQSTDASATNDTLKPLFDWAAQNPGTQIYSAGSVYSSFYSFYTGMIRSDDDVLGVVWLGGRLISKDALTKNAAKLAQITPEYMASSINVVGGGVIDQIDPASTALNPQWRKQALISWSPAVTWNEGTPESDVQMLKASLTNATQQIGDLAGLEHAAYFNEADPNEPLWKKSFFGEHYEKLQEIKQEVDPQGLFKCNRCVGSDY